MNNFSPNMMKTYENCPKKYFFKYIQNISMPQPLNIFEKGKKIHALANYYLRGADISNMINELNEDEKLVLEKLLNNEFFKKNYVNSEYNLSCKIGTYWVSGRLDALMHDGNDYFILDYKTGAIPKNPETDFQTMVYLMCADKKLKTYSSLKFIYIDLRNNRNAITELTQEKKFLYEKTLIETCKKIAEETEYSQKSDFCRFCEYSKLCSIY